MANPQCYERRKRCSVLAVLCGEFADRMAGAPEFSSAGHLDVHTLVNPQFQQFREAQRTVQPTLLFCQGQQVENAQEIGSLVWGKADVSDPDIFTAFLSPPFPTVVYLEVSNGKRLAQALHQKGISHVIYWDHEISSSAAAHFRRTLISVISAGCYTRDSYQLAHSSFRLYCIRNAHMLPNNYWSISGKLGPQLIGDAPKISVNSGMNDAAEEGSEALPTIEVYDEDVNMRFLICGVPQTPDASILAALEDGLSSLLNMEIHGSKLQSKVSASPSLQAGTFARGIITMRCNITTSSFTYISLLVSGNTETCFDDQLLEGHIKIAITEKSKVVHAEPIPEDDGLSSIEHLPSMTVACGSSVFEASMKVPKWASQILKQLTMDVSCRSLVALGITSINGTPVAAFRKEDVDLIFLGGSPPKDSICKKSLQFDPPRWAASLIMRRSAQVQDVRGRSQSRCKVAALRPLPQSVKRKMHSFLGFASTSARDDETKVTPSAKHKPVPVPADPKILVNLLPMKKHECDRPAIQDCLEEDFLRDVMQFLSLRGHRRLVPKGGLLEFPEAVLNAKRLDLYNLYKEVVSRGGFYVGNGINWKGQVFSKMRNHTTTNKMTGVGNTLKRHYETYLLEYELAHDDVGGDCCLLCRSGAPGDWVNCGLCGEWAHFGCDTRLGLGTFKDYAKTDGLEYMCPHCAPTNHKKRPGATTPMSCASS